MNAAALRTVLFRDSSTSASLDFDPVDTVDVGNLEISKDLWRNRFIVLGLSFFNLLGKFSETFFAVFLDVGVDDCLCIVSYFVSERCRRLSDDSEGGSIDVEPEESGVSSDLDRRT